MPRKARLDSPGTLHHVIIRGIEGRDIFLTDEDRLNFLDRVKRITGPTGTRLLAWALMRNHVHFLLFSGAAGLSAFMRKLLTGYALWFNRRHKRIGHLFQNRYKSIVCEENAYLTELVRYIHLNPLRSSLVNTLSALDEYPWCGHAVIVGNTRNEWQEVDYVLSLFGGNKQKALPIYRRFIAEGKDLGRRPELVGGG
ncbi:MAG TPA: transposase, partial [Thermodesulfobacteriota bacterium]|nr:transposase [Thermodesulfobacteriota bacterium]